jgi:hypothetical protein
LLIPLNKLVGRTLRIEKKKTLNIMDHGSPTTTQKETSKYPMGICRFSGTKKSG